MNKKEVLEYFGPTLPLAFEPLVVTTDLVAEVCGNMGKEVDTFWKAKGLDATFSVIVMDPSKPYLASANNATPGGELIDFAERVLFVTNFGKMLPVPSGQIGQALTQAKVAWVFGANSGAVEASRLRKGDCLESGAVWIQGLIVSVAGLDPSINADIARRIAQKISERAQEELTNLRSVKIV